jgi:hypothetical protein
MSGRAYKGKPENLSDIVAWPTPTVAEGGKIGSQANYGQKGLSNHPAIVGQPTRPKGIKDGKLKPSTHPDPANDNTSGKNRESSEENWATPQASDHIEGARTAPTSNQKCLGRDMNRTWPTSRASDAEGGRITTEETSEGFRSKREKSGQYFGAKLRDAVEMKKPTQAKLNPNWVEQLMGLPVGWTQLPTESTD